MAGGLAEAPGRADVLGVAEVLRAKLGEAGNPRRASEAAALAQVLSERSLKTYPSKRAIACGRGCNYCCHGLVAVMPPEAFRIAGAIRAGRAAGLDGDTVRQRAEPLRGLTPAERVGRKLPCPLLVEGECGAYAERPLVCRQTTSLSLPACIEEYEGHDRNGTIEISSTHLAHASNAHVALIGAMLAVGLPTEAYELGAVLEIALGDPSSEARWLAGESVFEALAVSMPRQWQVDTVAKRIAEELTA